jgi:hypothetical protein
LSARGGDDAFGVAGKGSRVGRENVAGADVGAGIGAVGSRRARVDARV